MIISNVKRLNAAKAVVAELEEVIAEELASLPASYGFDSVETFVAAIYTSGDKRRSGRPKKAALRVRKRAIITDALRAKVKSLVKAGRTGAEIAKAMGISLPSVQNIKKASGLVRSSIKSRSKAKTSRQRTPAKATLKPKRKRELTKKAASEAPRTEPPVEQAPVSV